MRYTSQPNRQLMQSMKLRLKEAREATGLTLEQASPLASLSAGQISRLERGTSEITLKQLVHFATLYKCTIADLIGNSVPLRNITVLGEIAAGEYWCALQYDPVDQFTVAVEMAPKSTRFTRFGLRVKGTSMDEMYPEGTILICIPFVEIERGPRHGERVIVYRRDRNTSDFEATCKEWQERDGAYWLVARSNDPKWRGEVIEIPTKPEDPDGDGFGFDWHGDEIQIYALVVDSIRKEVLDI